MPHTSRTPYSRMPLACWPEQDRILFHQIQGSGDPDNAVSERTVGTWKGLEYAFSAWLGDLFDNHPELLRKAPEQRLSPSLIQEYVDRLSATSSELSRGIMLQRLHLVLKDFAPHADLQWLYMASQRLLKRARPRAHKRVDAMALYRRGEELMQLARREADDLGYVSEGAGKLFRKGLEIMWFGLVTERLRAHQSLRIGESIVKIGDRWRMKLEEEYTKTKKRVRSRIPARLSPLISEYVERFRPAIPGANNHNGFWAAQSGRPMSRSTIYQSVTSATRPALGQPLSPHEFRRVVGTHWDAIAPDQPDKARLHLRHASRKITDEHYAKRPGHAGTGLTAAWAPYQQTANTQTTK